SASAPTADRVLLGAFPLEQARLDPNRSPRAPAVIFSNARGRWSEGLDAPTPAEAHGAPVAPRAELQAGERPAWRLGRRTPSGRTGGAAAALRPASEGAMEVGRLTHLWLERFGWLEDGAPEDDELLALAAAEGWKAPEAR